MKRVLMSLVPIILFATYLFGLRVLVMLSVVSAAAILTEYLVAKSMDGKKAKVTEAVLVSSFLYTLALPPSIPYWIAILGIIFGILFGKAAFGGYGKNIFNPALVGRCFIYISFPNPMTIEWTKPFQSFPGGLLRYSGGIDALSSATPIMRYKSEGFFEPYLNQIIGTTEGAMGATSVLLIVLAGIYLVYTKTASYKLMLSTIFAYAGFSTVFSLVGIVPGNPLAGVLSGGLMFGAVFMVTDPISAPKEEASKWIYGFIVGMCTFLITAFALFPGGLMFSVLIGNTFASLIDKYVKEFKGYWGKRQVSTT
jgi:Na+-transporting NADH:ubiquinone oxidoreductase subunit B